MGLDRLPTWARDLLLMLSASLLSWVSYDIVPILRHRGGFAALAASALIFAVGLLTPLTGAYGPGKRKDDEDTENHCPGCQRGAGGRADTPG